MPLRLCRAPLQGCHQGYVGRPYRGAVDNHADAGVESRAITDEQKAAIAEVRNFYEAKIAEHEVLHQSRIRATRDPAERETLAQEYRIGRERLTSDRESKIAKIRRG